MHIFIDETGSFSGVGNFPSVSLIGALIIPDANLPSLEKHYGKIRKRLPKADKGEVKGRTLDEQQVGRVVSGSSATKCMTSLVAICFAVAGWSASINSAARPCSYPLSSYLWLSTICGPGSCSLSLNINSPPCCGSCLNGLNVQPVIILAKLVTSSCE